VSRNQLRTDIRMLESRLSPDSETSAWCDDDGSVCLEGRRLSAVEYEGWLRQHPNARIKLVSFAEVTA
jgi:hypothetical protein